MPPPSSNHHATRVTMALAVHHTRVMSSPATDQLANQLNRAGYEERQLGALLLPDSATPTQYTAGYRLLRASHVPDLERLATFARASGRTIAIGPNGVVLT